MEFIAIDIGNTQIKSAFFRREEIGEVYVWSSLTELSASLELDAKGMISSVGYDMEEVKHIFSPFPEIKILQHTLPLPVSLDYHTPQTLGLDRIASVCGAAMLYPGFPLLVIDAGSCITYDEVDSSRIYHGGGISPGIKMRFKAMATFTNALPDLSAEWRHHQVEWPAKSTISCMIGATLTGIVAEVTHHIDLFKSKYKDGYVLLTGGDAAFFESRLKQPIFVRPNLVLHGLNRIRLYNEVI